MKYFKLSAVLIITALVLSACASVPGKKGWYQDWRKCAAVGGALGAAAGSSDDDTAIAGAVGGAIIGSLICAMSDTDADGVKNHKDDCPATPAGGIVDQRGCEIDSDGDGVVERLDECPGTPQGAAVDARGCEHDSDGDGVVNRLDQCPATPLGAVVDAHGCELDSDGDGTVDRLDQCPDTAHGTPVDNSGCELKHEYKMHGVNFEFDSADLTSDSNAALDDAVKILQRETDMQVEVAGHTDSRGNASYNQGLSERRAKAVADYLIAHGANAANISFKGYGESDPIADNATDAGRAANRRVELRH